MPDTTKPSTEALKYVDARVTQTRLVSEQISSLMTQIAKDPKPVQVRTETSSGFSVGLDHPEKPKTMTVELNYKVAHSVIETNQKLVDYDARHMALFEIHRQSGIESWLNVPTQALAPYFAFVHSMATRRAEHTFLEMGLRGIVLPRIADYEKSETEPVASIVPPVKT